MANGVTQYSVFVGSPGGLVTERKRFYDLLLKVTSLWAEPRGVHFLPVGWEDTVGGRGRPQERINQDLKNCDYAVFVLHDRWGTPTGRYSSGTEEELRLAEQLCARNQMFDMLVFFKKISPKKLKRPNNDVRKILDYRQSIGRKYLFKDYDTHEHFSYHLELSLAKWLRDHEDREASRSRSAVNGRSVRRASRRKRSR